MNWTWMVRTHKCNVTAGHAHDPRVCVRVCVRMCQRPSGRWCLCMSMLIGMAYVCVCVDDALLCMRVGSVLFACPPAPRRRRSEATPPLLIRLFTALPLLVLVMCACMHDCWRVCLLADHALLLCMCASIGHNGVELVRILLDLVLSEHAPLTSAAVRLLLRHFRQHQELVSAFAPVGPPPPPPPVLARLWLYTSPTHTLVCMCTHSLTHSLTHT
jgi:hypothetical protein